LFFIFRLDYAIFRRRFSLLDFHISAMRLSPIAITISFFASIRCRHFSPSLFSI